MFSIRDILRQDAGPADGGGKPPMQRLSNDEAPLSDAPSTVRGADRLPPGAEAPGFQMSEEPVGGGVREGQGARAPLPTRPVPTTAVQSRLAGKPAAPAALTTQQKEDIQGDYYTAPDGTVYTMKARAQPRGRGPAMATVEGKITQAPGLPGVRDAMEEQQRVQGRLTDAFIKQEAERAKILNETADAMEQESLRLGEMREQAMQASIAQTRQLQAQADEIGATAPQAGRLFGTGPQAASFGAALSIATGAMLSARTGGPNVALKIIDQAISRDMEVQKEAMRNKQFAATMGLNLAQEMRAAYRDDLAASNAMQATLLRYSENRIAAIVAQTNDPILRARGDETIANIQLKYATLVEELTRQSYGLRMALPLRQAQEMIAASAGQTIAPESQQDAASQAAEGGVGKAQAATEALGQNARQQAKQAEGNARGALKKRRAARKAAPPEIPPVRQRDLGRAPTPEDLRRIEAIAQQQGGPTYRAFGQGNSVVIVDTARMDIRGLDPKAQKRRLELAPKKVAVPPGVKLPEGQQRRVLREDGRAYIQVDPGTYDGDWKADNNKLKEFSKDAAQFEKIANRMIRRKGGEGAVFFKDPDVVNDVNTAVSIYNRLLGGGVLDRNEFDRYSAVFSDPQGWMWNFGLFKDKEARRDVWRNAAEMMKDTVRDQAAIMANNGVLLPGFEAPTFRGKSNVREDRPDG